MDIDVATSETLVSNPGNNLAVLLPANTLRVRRDSPANALKYPVDRARGRAVKYDAL